MIITQTAIIDGVSYMRTYSDAGMLIERDGALYEEAIDPAGSGRTYTESDQPIPDEEAEESDYLAALARLGVEA